MYLQVSIYTYNLSCLFVFIVLFYLSALVVYISLSYRGSRHAVNLSTYQNTALIELTSVYLYVFYKESYASGILLTDLPLINEHGHVNFYMGGDTSAT
jgi:hypothetical protein